MFMSACGVALQEAPPRRASVAGSTHDGLVAVLGVGLEWQSGKVLLDELDQSLGHQRLRE